jgi:oligoribonuclease
MVELNFQHGGAFALLWVDLETTGSEEDKDDIIEIGATMTDFDFERVDYRAGRDFSMVIEPSEYALGRLMKNGIVRQMHNENGLLEDCVGDPTRKKCIEEAEAELINWMSLAVNSRKQRGSAEKYKYMLAGSGVGHFDRRFINQHMPRLARLLTFAPLDVGMIRRFLKISGVDPSFADNTHEKNHRALDDVLLHLEEARAYRDRFSKLFAEDDVLVKKPRPTAAIQ